MAFPIAFTRVIDENALQQGAFLWVTHADKIPPHIGISLNGNYFSLQVSGKDDVEAASILRAIRLRKVPALFIQLQEHAFDAGRFLAVKNEYVAINEKVKTCLIPVLDLFGQKILGLAFAGFLKIFGRKSIHCRVF